MAIDFADLKTQYRELKASIDARIQTVLDHGQFILGPEVGELETQLAQYTGAQYCITVASGTDALLISLMTLGIKPGHYPAPFTVSRRMPKTYRCSDRTDRARSG